MINITIQKNVALPDRANHNKFPFSDMEVGDSFSVPKSLAAAAKRASWAYGDKNGRKYTVRTLKDESIRIWRIK